MDDASLEDFLGGSEHADGDATADGDGSTDGEEPTDGREGTDGSGSADRTTPEDAAGAPDDGGTDTANATADTGPISDPTHSTYCWTPEGAECAECGATVGARWRDDGRFVCPDCKAW